MARSPRRPAAVILAGLGVGLGLLSARDGQAFAGLRLQPAARQAATRCQAHGAAGQLPSLYVYDHCPFCVRARMIFGLKGIRHNLVWMSNDDVQTPTSLVGKKIAPILEMPGEAPMPESLDIIKKIDEGYPDWGAPLLKPATGRKDLKEWQAKTNNVMRFLVRPRYYKAFFPEFAFARAREAFVRNHPIADPNTGEIPDKETWLEMGPDTWNAWYGIYMEKSPELLKELNSYMDELEDLIHSEESISPGGLSYDDICFWDRLRGVTLVKGIRIGPKARAYIESMSRRTDIPLLDSLAM